MKRRLKYIFTSVLLTLTLQLTVVDSSYAQCPMCRMSAESNLKEGGKAGRGLNAGILYMLSTPYLLVAGIGIFWYMNRKGKEGEFGEDANNDFSKN